MQTSFYHFARELNVENMRDGLSTRRRSTVITCNMLFNGKKLQKTALLASNTMIFMFYNDTLTWQVKYGKFDDGSAKMSETSIAPSPNNKTNYNVSSLLVFLFNFQHRI